MSGVVVGFYYRSIRFPRARGGRRGGGGGSRGGEERTTSGYSDPRFLLVGW